MVLVCMKKLLLIIFAFIVALMITELISSVLLSYPKAYPSISYRINDLLKSHRIIKIRAPYYKSINSEGEIKIIEYNNIGLPGTDIDTNKKDGYIFLIGNSFVEATTVSKNDQASSILNNYIKQENQSNQVINLGISTGDPYVQWFRTMYFEKFYKPSVVILVLESLWRVEKYLNRYDTIDFSQPDYFGNIIPKSLLYKLSFPFRAHFSFINLISQTIPEKNNKININSEEFIPNNINIPERLTICLDKFHDKYKESFYIVSIIDDHFYNLKLKEHCDSIGIKFLFDESVMKTENLINGQGHLNENGNSKLAEIIFEAIKEKLTNNE